MNFEEAVERLLEPENVAVSQTLGLYEHRERHNDSTTIPRQKLKDFLRVADSRRRALKDERGRETLYEILRQHGRAREGSNLETTLHGRDTQRIRLSDGTDSQSGIDVKIPGEFSDRYAHPVVQELLKEIHNEEKANRQNRIRELSRSEIQSGFSNARSIDDLKREAREAFPNVKITERGNTLQMEMPNGQRVTVTLSENITATEEELAAARKAHGIAPGASVTIEGYAETVNGDGFIALSQGSREGTGFHEAYHIAEAMAFTKKELADAKRLISPDEEKRADMYAAWVKDRKNNRNFAKLWQKIKDMAAGTNFISVENKG